MAPFVTKGTSAILFTVCSLKIKKSLETIFTNFVQKTCKSTRRCFFKHNNNSQHFYHLVQLCHQSYKSKFNKVRDLHRNRPNSFKCSICSRCSCKLWDISSKHGLINSIRYSNRFKGLLLCLIYQLRVTALQTAMFLVKLQKQDFSNLISTKKFNEISKIRITIFMFTWVGIKLFLVQVCLHPNY